MLPAGATSSEEVVQSCLRDLAQTLYHPVGTCSMGSEATSVLDPELRVRSVSGLRVVDASAMPRLVRGHTNAATIMLAERASDLMRTRNP
jgi:choline dehydrogenase